MTDIIIRPLRESDRSEVHAFFDSMGEESTKFFNVNRGNELATLHYLDSEAKDRIVWAADDNGTLAGIVFIWDKQSAIPWLGIAVRDSYHGRHIGTQLLKYVIDYTKQNGCGGILLTTAKTNFKAQGLYEKCGFERLGVHPGGEYIYILRFKKQ